MCVWCVVCGVSCVDACVCGVCCLYDVGLSQAGLEIHQPAPLVAGHTAHMAHSTLYTHKYSSRDLPISTSIHGTRVVYMTHGSTQQHNTNSHRQHTAQSTEYASHKHTSSRTAPTQFNKNTAHQHHSSTEHSTQQLQHSTAHTANAAALYST